MKELKAAEKENLRELEFDFVDCLIESYADRRRRRKGGE
jgi:predicted nucleic acid-binding protein